MEILFASKWAKELLKTTFFSVFKVENSNVDYVKVLHNTIFQS